MGVETAVALALVGGAASGMASFRAGQGQQLAAERQADQLKTQAEIADQQGIFAYNKIKSQASMLEGKQRAGIAAGNLAVTGGTATKIIDQTAVLSEADAKQAKLNAMRQAWGLRAQADVVNAQGDMAMEAGRTAAFTSFLGASAQGASTYATMSPGKPATTPKSVTV